MTSVPDTPYPARAHLIQAIRHLRSAACPSPSAPAAVVLFGRRTPFRDDTDRELRFRQESNFFYCTGVDLPQAILFCPIPPSTTADPEPILFLAEQDPEDVMWSGARPTLAELRSSKTLDIPDLRPLTAWYDFVSQIDPQTTLHGLPQTPLFPVPDMPPTDSATPSLKWDTTHLLMSIQRARLVKDAYEIALLRRANEVSSAAHEAVMRTLGQQQFRQGDRILSVPSAKLLVPSDWELARESDAEALLEAYCRRQGARHMAYESIIASGPNSSTLHWCCGESPFMHRSPEAQKRMAFQSEKAPSDLAVPTPTTQFLTPQVLLIDAGCEWQNYAADITRSMPVGNGGHFNKETAEIYQLVLHMQTECARLAKPGKSWEDVHLHAHRVLIEGFLALGIFKGDPEAIFDSQLSSAFFPHGLGHSLGLDVHDCVLASLPDGPGEGLCRYLRLRLPLQEGFCVTIEPGIYFNEHLLKPWREHEYLQTAVMERYEQALGAGGIRIEDDYIVNSVGVENLTSAPKELAEIQGLCSEETV